MNNQNVKDFYITTNGTTYQNRSKHHHLSNELYKKAPGHWKVDYAEDMTKKVLLILE